MAVFIFSGGYTVDLDAPPGDSLQPTKVDLLVHISTQGPYTARLSRSLSVFLLLHINPQSLTPPICAYLRIPREMLLAAYIAIISPEVTM